MVISQTDFATICMCLFLSRVTHLVKKGIQRTLSLNRNDCKCVLYVLKMSSITSQLIAAKCVTRKMYFADSTDFVTIQFSSKIRFDERFHFSNTKTGSEYLPV